MMDMEKLCKVVETELQKIAEKGLSTSNLETAYKLIDMYKDLKNTEYWEIKSEYYMQEMGGDSQEDGYAMNSYGGGNSYSNRHRDSRGRYSRGDDHEDYGAGMSGRGRRRSHYSRNDGHAYTGDRYERYMDSKNSYRAGKSPECKQRLMATLEDYMDDFSAQMEEMLRDADCQEERETIERYLKKIKGFM